MARTLDHAQAGLLAKLPPGWAYTRAPNSVLGRTLRPLAAEAVAFEAQAEAQLTEVDPGAAVLLLDGYERVLGPDPCMAPAPSLAARQAGARMRWVARGGASRAYFTNLAAQFGAEVDIQEFQPSRFGRPFGRPFGGVAWAYTWRVTATAMAADGGSLECRFRRVMPAHTVLQFGYRYELLDSAGEVLTDSAGNVLTASQGNFT